LQAAFRILEEEETNARLCGALSDEVQTAAEKSCLGIPKTVDPVQKLHRA
jgi:hypothetical protein